jgi:hypothetical protein
MELTDADWEELERLGSDQSWVESRNAAPWRASLRENLNPNSSARAAIAQADDAFFRYLTTCPDETLLQSYVEGDIARDWRRLEMIGYELDRRCLSSKAPDMLAKRPARAPSSRAVGQPTPAGHEHSSHRWGMVGGDKICLCCTCIVSGMMALSPCSGVVAIGDVILPLRAELIAARAAIGRSTPPADAACNYFPDGGSVERTLDGPIMRVRSPMAFDFYKRDVLECRAALYSQNAEGRRDSGNPALKAAGPSSITPAGEALSGAMRIPIMAERSMRRQILLRADVE